MPFRYNRKKVALTYPCPVGEQHPWPDKELAFIAMDYHFSTKGKQITQYLVAEECHENGELHYHAYLEFDSAIDTRDSRYFDIDDLHPNIGDKPGKKWCDYCAKDGNYVTNFYVSKANIYKQALQLGGLEGANLIKEHHPRDYIMNKHKIISSLTTHYIGERRVIWIYGPPGTGKSYAARQMGAKPNQYDGKFYANSHHEVMVFEEIDKMKMPLDQFLQITDSYELDVRVLGNWAPWVAKTIIFTSTVPWDGVFVHDQPYQIERRITDIVEFTDYQTYVVHKGSFNLN